MTLQDFVSESLRQISEGVAAARHANNKIGGIVMAIGKQEASCTLGDSSAGFLVNFDVAVTVSETKTKDMSGGVVVATVFKAGGQKGTVSEECSISRVQFSVPIAYRTKAENFAEGTKALEERSPGSAT